MEIYELGKKERPRNNLKLRILFRLLKVPLIQKYCKYFIRKELNIPQSVAFNEGFYCSTPNIEVGEHTGLGNLYIRSIGKVSIGKYCSFSYNNMILTGTHDYNNFGTVIAKPVTIGDNVWVTSNVTILPGVTIGSNTVIGAGSVVTKDIPSGVFAAGNPCKIIKAIQFKIET